MERPEPQVREHTVRKEITILYRGKAYSLPLGTYCGAGNKELLLPSENNEEIDLYDRDLVLITRHTVSIGKGGYINHITRYHRAGIF